MVRRANGSPTWPHPQAHQADPATAEPTGPSRGAPRSVADTASTATAPGAGQPLQKRAPPASRTPPIHVRSDEERSRVPHALRKARNPSPDPESRSLMQPDPVPILIPVLPGDPRRPGRIHDDQLGATPAALPLQRRHYLARTEVRENTPEMLPLLPQPGLLPAEVRILRNHRNAAPRSLTAD